MSDEVLNTGCVRCKHPMKLTNRVVGMETSDEVLQTGCVGWKHPLKSYKEGK